jgi:hypothetical protein
MLNPYSPLTCHPFGSLQVGIFILVPGCLVELELELLVVGVHVPPLLIHLATVFRSICLFFQILFLTLIPEKVESSLIEEKRKL